MNCKTFLTNRVLLLTVGLWIKTLGESGARKQLQNTGISKRGIDQIIKAANEYLSHAPCDY
jgi:hypothetical protein